MTGRESSLFDRICEAANTISHPQEALLYSVRNNLRNVLNTRSGSCYGSPALGIVDFNDDRAADSIPLRERAVLAIKNCILRYEPRISDVVVTAAAEESHAPMDLRFHIVAQVNFSDLREVLEFDILLDNHQHWRVEPL
ncbi:MAG: type VI secretion system baseplate subunit TssE [Kluyvera sp.]